MKNPRSAAHRADLRRSFTLVLLVVSTALVLLLGHSLERLHDATASSSASAGTTTQIGAQSMGQGVEPASTTALATDALGVGFDSELCAAIASVCAVMIIIGFVILRARPGRGVPASIAPPRAVASGFANALGLVSPLSTRSFALRL